jgi:hypothetical protein
MAFCSEYPAYVELVGGMGLVEPLHDPPAPEGTGGRACVVVVVGGGGVGVGAIAWEGLALGVTPVVVDVGAVVRTGERGGVSVGAIAAPSNWIRV